MSDLANHRVTGEFLQDGYSEEQAVASEVRPCMQSTLSVKADGASVPENDAEFDSELLTERIRMSSLVRQAREITMYGLVPEDHPLYVKVQELYRTLKVPEEKRCSIHILKNVRTINACVYADGKIFIDAGTFFKLPPYEEVWQALLAHEQCHFSEGHHNRKLISRDASFGSAVALKRMLETEADTKGAIALLEQSGVNPLGAKVLMQALATVEKPGFHHATHGSALDRVLNTETVFGMYDLKSLTGVMTPVELPGLKDDSALQRDGNIHIQSGDSHEEGLAKISRMDLATAAGWRQYYVKFARKEERIQTLYDRKKLPKSDNKYPELIRACQNRVVDFFNEQFQDIAPESREKLILLFHYFYHNFDPFKDEITPDLPLNQLEMLLKPSIWSRLPAHVVGSHFERLTELVVLGAIKEGFDTDSFLDHWVGNLADHFSSFGAKYSTEVIRKVLKARIDSEMGLKKSKEVSAELVPLFQKMAGFHSQFSVKLQRKLERTAEVDYKIPKHIQTEFDALTGDMSVAEVFDFLKQFADFLSTRLKVKSLRFGSEAEKDRAEEFLFFNESSLDFFLTRLLESRLTRGCPPEKQAAKSIAVEALYFTPAVGFFWFAEKEQNLEDVIIARNRMNRRRAGKEGTEFSGWSFTSSGSATSSQAVHSYKLARCIMEGRDERVLEKTDLLISTIDSKTSSSNVLGLLDYLLKPEGFHAELGSNGWDSIKDDLPYSIAKKLSCHYLALVSDNKKRLKSVWREFSDAGYIPSLLNRKNFSTYLHVFQFKAMRLDWDLDDVSDARFLMEFAHLLEDADQRSRLLTVATDSYLKSCSYDEKIQYLFGTSSVWIRDLSLQKVFIEREAVTHEQIRRVRSTIERTLKENTQDPAAPIGYVAILDQLSLTTSSEILELFLKTRDGDRELKDKLFTTAYTILERDMGCDSYGGGAKHSKTESQACVHRAESVLNQLFNSSLAVRYALARHLLVKGQNPVLFSAPTKRRFFDVLLSGVLSSQKNQQEVRAVIQSVLEAIADVPEWEELYFAIAPVVAENILLDPEKKTPWKDMYCVEEVYGVPYTQPKRKIALKAGKYAVDPGYSRRALSDQVERFLSGQKEFTQRREKMSPIQLVVKVAQHLGAPAVRFLQVLGQYVNIPPQYEEQFLKVYDAVQGQNKLLADVLLEREFEGYREAVEGLNFTAGGGSIMTVFGTSPEGEAGDVLKVRNPNVLYRMELAFGFIQKIINNLIEKDPAKYTVLQDAFQDIAEWIRHDIKDEDFLKKDAEFRARHDGFTAEGSAYRVRVPRTKEPDSEYFKREEYAPGLNLTAWNELVRNGHDMKDVISLMVKNYLTQLGQPVNEQGVIRLHADVHPGNFRVDSENNLWILDRNGYLDYDARDMEFFSGLMGAGSEEQFTEALVSYFADDGNKSEVQKMIEDRIKGKNTTDFLVLQEILSQLRRMNVRIPLKITLLLKNLNTLNRFAKKAGFEQGMLEAMVYRPKKA